MSDQDHALLLAALSERYEAMRVIRGRAQDISLWTAGLFLGAAGWLIGSDHHFSSTAKLAFLVTIIAALIVVRLLYLADLAKGFSDQQRVAAKIEEALGYFTPGKFEIADTVYPRNWLRAGAISGKGALFSTNFAIIYVASGVLVAAIAGKGHWF